MTDEVGNDIEAICGKCGEVAHVVVAITEGKVAQVECKQCGARHRYRLATGRAKPARKAAKKTTRKATKGTAASRKKSAKKDVVEADPSRPPRPFSMNDTYQIGDRVIHKIFGDGVVQAVTGPAKVEILFDVGSKIMVQGRSTG